MTPTTLTRLQARVADHIDAIAQGHIEGRNAAANALTNIRSHADEITVLLSLRDRGELS